MKLGSWFVENKKLEIQVQEAEEKLKVVKDVAQRNLECLANYEAEVDRRRKIRDKFEFEKKFRDSEFEFFCQHLVHSLWTIGCGPL